MVSELISFFCERALLHITVTVSIPIPLRITSCSDFEGKRRYGGLPCLIDLIAALAPVTYWISTMDDPVPSKRLKVDRKAAALLEQLYNSVDRGDLEGVKSCVEELKGYSQVSIQLNVLVRRAVTNRNRAILEYLLQLRNATVMPLTEEDLRVDLMEAVTAGDLGIVRTIVEVGKAKVNGARDQVHAIHRAAGEGHVEIVKYLISQGAKLDTALKTPLHHACAGSTAGNYGVVKYLVEEAGVPVDVGAYSKCGTPLHMACFRFGMHADENALKIIQYLITTGNANINSRSEDGKTPFRLACMNGNSEAGLLLLGTGKVEMNDSDMEGILRNIRYSYYHVDILNRLVELKMVSGKRIIQFFARCFENAAKEALRVACSHNWSPTVVQLIVESSHLLDINPQNGPDDTPLIIASGESLRLSHGYHARLDQDQERLVRWLLFEKEVNITPRDKKGKTAQEIAQKIRGGTVHRIFQERQGYILNRWKLVDWLGSRNHFSRQHS